MIFNNFCICQDIRERLQTLLFRKNIVELSPREGIVKDVEQAIPFGEVIVNKIYQIVSFSNRLNYLSEKLTKFIGFEERLLI